MDNKEDLHENTLSFVTVSPSILSVKLVLRHDAVKVMTPADNDRVKTLAQWMHSLSFAQMRVLGSEIMLAASSTN